jgi:glycosyltransferase involved in cell wall biosynthesis
MHQLPTDDDFLPNDANSAEPNNEFEPALDAENEVTFEQPNSSAKPKRNVLVLAYYFPPMGLSGVQRTLKFVKYLPEFGWRPIVVTAGETPYYAMDDSLIEEIQPQIDAGDIVVHRTKSSGAPGAKIARKEGKLLKLPSDAYQRFRSKLIQTFLQPDSRVRWKKHALKLIAEIYKTERIDAILTTAPPYTSFLIARELRAKYGTPYLMDYRDAWVSNKVLNFYATPFHKAYARKLEDECLRASDAITVVNRRMKEVLIRDYEFLSHEDVSILPHGYDREDIDKAAPFADHLKDPGRFRITYSGAFYVGRSPRVMLEAAKEAMLRIPEIAKHLELMFVGVLQKDYHNMIRKMGLEQVVTEKGYVAHRESVGLLLSSDVLWMTMSDDISAPGKLYEYIGTGKPIIGLVPKRSQAERMLEEYGAGMAVQPDDVKGLTELIIKLYHSWQRDALPSKIDPAFVKSFDRRELTREMSRQLAMIANLD